MESVETTDRAHHRRRFRGRDPSERHCTATPLELLYDLTMVAAFGVAANELAHYLADGHLLAGIGGFAFAAFAGAGRGSTTRGSRRPTTPTTGCSTWRRWCR